MTAARPADAGALTQALKRRALELGFDAVGIAAVEPLEDREHLERWLAQGRHGLLGYMARTAAKRGDPALVLADCRAVVCVALCFGPERDPRRDARVGRIARYAVGDDYHAVMGEKLEALTAWLREAAPHARTRWYVDTGPVLERAWAERAGLGWIGKHSGLLSSERGSWFLLGEILVDQPLVPDRRATHHCGTCTACIGACPTGAIVAPYQVDARRCISYLTIELRGPIPHPLRPLIGDHIFGCDLCQDVCPWNRFARAGREARLAPRANLDRLVLVDFLALTDADFAALFAGSPIRRAKRGGFLRNVCVALGNRGDAAAVGPLARTLAGDHDPVVRGHAAWALGVIDRQAATDALQRARDCDPDATVREEAAAALAGG